jgi:hypothetical protein
MATSDLYGFRSDDIEAIRSRIEALFGLPMEAHESSYIPAEEYYRLELPGGERLSLQKNYDAAEQQWVEEDFSAMAVLLYVEAQDRADELRQRLVPSLEGIEFLQREVCTPERRFIRIRNVGGQDVVVFEKDLADTDVLVRGA